MSVSSRTYNRSLFTRLAVALIGLPALIFTFVSAVSGWQTMEELRGQIINQINDDMANLAEIYLDEGPVGVDQAIERRLDLLPLNRAGAHYHFEDGDDIVRAGDLSDATADRAREDRASEVTSDSFGRITLRSTVFQGGERLVVARENTPLRDARSVLLRNYLLGLVALLLGSIAMTLLFTERLRRRVGTMNAVLDSVGKGHLDRRLPDADQPDEIGELTAHINAMIGRAERLLTLRKRVTDQVAHEMRSPLTRLDAALQKAQARVNDDPEIAKAREALTSSIQLLDGLLDVSSADAQKGDRRDFQNVDLAELVGNVVELYEPVAELRGHTLLMDAVSDCHVEAAPAQLGRLISNLIDNALKYADANTEVRLRIRCDDGHVRFSVANTGPRITGDLQNEIFTPFYRHPDMAETEGHGLGLALCRSIAARHDGSLEITPDPDLTIFTLILPRSRET